MPVIKPESVQLASQQKYRNSADSLCLSLSLSLYVYESYSYIYLFIYISLQIITIYVYYIYIYYIYICFNVFLCVQCLAKVGFRRFFKCRHNLKEHSSLSRYVKGTFSKHDLNPPVQELKCNQKQSVDPTPQKIYMTSPSFLHRSVLKIPVLATF